MSVMGKGLALQFRQAFPYNFREYKEACRANEVKPGQMFTVGTDKIFNPSFIINFPTKRHWKDPSRLEDIESGLEALITELDNFSIKSVAIPALGCGYGGLDWEIVKPMIVAALSKVPDVDAFIFEPC
jgi:O-acetyl-ADP-ribose deacetylase (regulator of RNase III)